MWLFCFVLFCMLRSLIAYLVKEQLAGGAAWRICDVISPPRLSQRFVTIPYCGQFSPPVGTLCVSDLPANVAD